MPSITEQLEALQKENELLREQNRLLREKIHLMVHQVFNKKSEQLAPGQLEFLFNDQPPGKPGLSEEFAAPSEATSRRKPQPRKPRYPEDLPVEITTLDPSAVEANPSQWRQIGQEISEQLDYIPASFIRRQLVRRTWVKKDDPDPPPLTAALPEKLLERGLLAPGLLTHVVVSKYQDHQPLYRQEQNFRQRHGVHLGRNTLCRGVELVATWLKPIADQIFEEQIDTGYLQVDETPVKYLQGKGRASKGYLWVAHPPGGDAVYHWAPGRGYEHLKKWLPDKSEFVLQSDNYQVYEKFSKEQRLPGHAACWAHTRRKFYEAQEVGEQRARMGWILHQIGLLYKIEEHLRSAKAGSKIRHSIRQSESKMVVDRIFRVLDHWLKRHAFKPQTRSGKALSYALKLRAGLQVFLDHGQVEIDTNLVENAIRPAALGRKNWMFIGNQEAGWRSAVIYTILQSCKRHDIHPEEYLKDVLERLPYMTNQQIPTLTPRAWAQVRSMKKAS